MGGITGNPVQNQKCDTPEATITSATYDHGKTLAEGSHIHSPIITFNFTGTSNIGNSEFECSLDGSAFAACTGPVTYKVGNGQHTFEVRAVDSNGLADTSPATFSWTRGK